MRGDGRKGDIFLGINLMQDPAVAAIRDGRVLAYSEEERHVRIKHAPNRYPMSALRYCLDVADCDMEDVAAVCINWNIDAYTDGRMSAFFESIRAEHPIDDKTIAWQNSRLQLRSQDVYRENHEFEWRREFGDIRYPKIITAPHHYTHAFQAFMQSPFDHALCLTIDGSGDQHCTVVWRCEDDRIEPLKELNQPQSLGWLYAAFTEYLGFQAYEGEYKVMGLAAYGRPDADLKARILRIARPAADGVGYEIDGTYIHYGSHRYSKRFTDKLVELLGRPPRTPDEPITEWHENLAHTLQQILEEHVIRLVCWGIAETGFHNVCIGGGVGLNVKMNSRLFQLDQVHDVFAHPLCSDAGAAAGAALLVCQQNTGARPEQLSTLALGYEESGEDIVRILKSSGLLYETPSNICSSVAEELAHGRIVGWFQGRMEAGPRALGQRSILADPRQLENRDKVNAIVKFREHWRPFCPSIMAEYMDRYFDSFTEAPFMIISFIANEKLCKDAPAIVHIDGTSRVQMVHQAANPRYHSLLAAFNELTGVPILLNTSFNVKGEPIVCSARDALRTFWSTGLEVLALGDYLIRKPVLD